VGKGTGKLRNRLRELRKQRGEMTQQELADCAGITRQTVIAIEQNKYSPSLEVAFLIARALGVEIGDAFSYEEEPKRK